MSKKPDKAMEIVLSGLIIVLALYGFMVLVFSKPHTENPEINVTEDFAQCLTDKGAVMYGTEWCHYCQNQKEMFGEHFENITYVDCGSNKAACTDAGVRGYPTWVIDGISYPGMQQLETLAELSGCEF